jgi:hypothetical protein
MAIVLAGDTLTQAVYEWYEAADLLSQACYNSDPLSTVGGFMPSEAVVALLLEPEGSRASRSYASLRSGRWAAGGEPRQIVRQMLGGAVPSLTICAGNGAPCASSPAACSAHMIVGHNAAILPAQAVAAGLADTGALLHLVLALSSGPGSGQALMLGTSGDSGFAALLLELP